MRTFCVTSGKGGVGKTTLSINLGIAMAQSNHRVLLLDGDMGLANINVMMGLIPRFTIHDVVRGQKTLPQIVMSTPYGVDMIAGASGIAELADPGEPERMNILRGLEELSGYDTLIIDTGAGIGDSVIRFVLAADETVIVTTPDPTSLTDAYGIIKTILGREFKPLRLLVNRVDSAQDAQRIAGRLASVTDKFMNGNLEFIGYVPPDPLIEKSILLQKPHLALNPMVSSAQRIRQAAKRLRDGKAAGAQDDGGMKGFLQRLFGR